MSFLSDIRQPVTIGSDQTGWLTLAYWQDSRHFPGGPGTAPLPAYVLWFDEFASQPGVFMQRQDGLLVYRVPWRHYTLDDMTKIKEATEVPIKFITAVHGKNERVLLLDSRGDGGALLAAAVYFMTVHKWSLETVLRPLFAYMEGQSTSPHAPDLLIAERALRRNNTVPVDSLEILMNITVLRGRNDPRLPKHKLFLQGSGLGIKKEVFYVLFSSVNTKGG